MLADMGGNRFCVGLRTIALAACAALCILGAPASAQNMPPPSDAGPFTKIGRWLDDSYQWMRRGVTGAGREVGNLGREAGIAAKSTADAASDAADGIARIPSIRVVSGHETCPRAANGAPNCMLAADKLCQSKGFASGKSVSMTTAQECPVQVMLGQRAAEAGECRDVTFVSQALCN
jgi:hypothetical protein